ncbi:hypothetical protein [Cellulomonas carbonis]|uniref:Uncharacterized protein n=1 Tax=Cellulomonas carbonis T26 TaxID=947969 RepID=A0A0A0BRT2_9CELL|nr:hypothetical protein [Cellulomonas carbonis]KGM11168.1 hypothetical protein N868_10035 [Cellulomonas carbonis T26]GGC05234.1 hypothetical protein GCM10010972_17990 [Cellulomonas carbonis]
MSDPATLREQAHRLRLTARTLRTQGHGLDDQVRRIRREYPLPSPELWRGPYADRYAEELDTVVADLRRVGDDVARFADDCEAEASEREARAAQLEAQEAAAQP